MTYCLFTRPRHRSWPDRGITWDIAEPSSLCSSVVCVALLSRTSCVRVRHQGVLDPIPDVRSTAAKAMGQLVQGMGAEALGDQVIGRNRGREDLRTEQRSRPSAFLLCFVAATSS